MNAKSLTLLLYLLWTSFHAAAVESVAASVPQPTAPTASAPTPAWLHREMEGWSLQLRPALVEGTNAPATEMAVQLLRQQLQEIVRVVPARAVRELQRVPLYFSPEYPARKPTAEYHPDAGWLRANGRDPAMAKGVEFTNVRYFPAEMERMPNFTLHELAHAYHDRVLPQGFAHVELQAAYQRAKASGRYEHVERRFGNGRSNTFERAYAMTDAMEYFAETTEAFFGRNDFFPFTRAELAAHDPEMFAMIGRLWGQSSKAQSAFAHRGYYLCFMRMPTFGLPAWRAILDGAAEDGVNTVILWMGGAFRSQKFPITWQWARDHENVRADFGRELIRHAHRRGIQVLLGFTPFGYDGVNQLPLEKPELKAVGQDGQPVREFGIGCWGWNLCPAKAESQRFMREYVREMAFEFYPEADGLFIESSDYAVCHCAECGPKYFDHEFAFVRAISDEVWARRTDATVVVYPHYFSGAKLRFSFAEATAAQQPFDARWTLFFTPHSAPLEPALIAQARGAWWWNEAPSRFDIDGIRAGVRKAREAHCTGYVPSLECYSYVQTHEEFGEPWLKGKRQVPFGFGWLKTGENPYGELPVRAVRIAFRELTADPELPEPELYARLGRELFGAEGNPGQVEDLLFLLQVFNTDRNWAVPGALTTPGLVRSRAEQGRLNLEKRDQLRAQLARVQAMAERYRDATSPGVKELQRIAQWLVDQWAGAASDLWKTP